MKYANRKRRSLYGGNGDTAKYSNFFTYLGREIYDMFGMIAWFILALFSNDYASKSNGYFGKSWIQGKSVILSELKKSKRSYG